MSLVDLIQVISLDDGEEPEDIFASAPGLIFTDDLRNLHGDPHSIIVYKSARFGRIELTTADPARENERQLFAHYLWNAGVKMAELISRDSDPCWSVQGETVLELGAGVGLCGIVATLAGANSVVISDYPSDAILNNIRSNAKKAIPALHTSRYRIEGYEWGDTQSELAVREARRFTRLLAADCFWMPHEHGNLVQSMLHFLDPSPQATVFAVAGFHTGRAKLANFFEVAESNGLETAEIYEEDAYGNRREWATERDGGTEHTTERKKWLVIARLKRRLLGGMPTFPSKGGGG